MKNTLILNILFSFCMLLITGGHCIAAGFEDLVLHSNSNTITKSIIIEEDNRIVTFISSISSKKMQDIYDIDSNKATKQFVDDFDMEKANSIDTFENTEFSTFLVKNDEFVDSFDAQEQSENDSFQDDFDKNITTSPSSSTSMYSMNEDIFEDFNRSVYNFNTILYQVVLAPVAKTYGLFTTEEIRSGIGNMLDNIQAPLRIILNILQGKFENAGIEFSRFIVNSTVGLLGYVDITARNTPASYTIESVNTTLAAWKIPSGPFVMLPFLGPSTVRRTASYIIGSYVDPMKYVWNSSIVSASITSAKIINNSPFYLDILYKIEDTSFEPYTAMRTLFLQIDSAPRKL